MPKDLLHRGGRSHIASGGPIINTYLGTGAKPLGTSATEGLHSAVFYGVFLLFVGWALIRGAARSGAELGYAAAAATMTVPIATLVFSGTRPANIIGVDIMAALLAIVLLYAARSAKSRASSKPYDSVWAHAGNAADGRASLPT